jgi:hypothetical protein
MTLESQIQQFINTAKLGDVMLLSKDGGRGSGNGLILKTIGAGFTLFHDGRQLCTWNCGTPAVNKELLLWGHTVDSVLKEALLWSYRTGQELASPNPEAGIRDLLIARCQWVNMSQDEAQDFLSDILGDLADWMDQRHASPQTAELIRAISSSS